MHDIIRFTNDEVLTIKGVKMRNRDSDSDHLKSCLVIICYGHLQPHLL